jgi:nucleoside 2-deoxyribosyltransferase
MAIDRDRFRVWSVYVAAKYERQSEAKLLTMLLQAAGARIMSTWVDEPLAPDVSEWTDYAKKDVNEIQNSSVLIVLTNQEGRRSTTGGHHWETGYAYALGKRIVLIGPKENVFHYLPGMEHYPDLEAFLAKYRIGHALAGV